MAGSADKAYSAIRGAVLAGRYAPGERLPEEDLAAEIGVSRTPIREALRRLAADGFVDFHPNRGAQVAEVTDQDLREIYGLRALLEGHAARLAADRIGDDDLERLRRLCADMEAQAGRRRPDLGRIAELNDEFHKVVLAAAGNRRLVDMVAGLVQVPLVHRTFHRYTPEHLARSLAHHRELVAALEQRDLAWAEAVMRSHVLAARTVLMTAG